MNESPHDPNVGDQNIERLLSTAYQPEQPADDLLPRVERSMTDAAHAHEPKPADPRLARVRWRLAAVMSAAAMVAGIFLLMHARRERSENDGQPQQASARPGSIDPTVDPKMTLTPRPRGAVKAPEKLQLSQSIQTKAGQRQRKVLPDGSVLYVNQNTEVVLVEDRTLHLKSGEVFVEVAPQDKNTGKKFTVHTPQRDVVALGTKFAVDAHKGPAGVLVTQGKVRVSDVGDLTASDQLEPGESKPHQAERASHRLDWTRELMAAAESPLVPDSKYSGGALVAVDPYGQEAKLSLRKYHVDVHIEDGFARTIIDQTYFNHNAWRMEGTFYFPLPADASLSRLAMYVGPDLMEGGMAERDYARNVYEEIRYTQSDPALLEWVDGSTFKMRVFPLEGRQEKRLLIGYTQRLSSLDGHAQYRFPGGHNLNLVDEWKFHARIKNVGDLAYSCDSHALKSQEDKGDLFLDAVERRTKLDRDVVIDLHEKGEPRSQGLNAAHFSSMTTPDGYRYLMMRYRPQMLVQKKRESRDWVFLFESSGDRDPLLARVQVDVIRSLLTNAEHNDTFAIVAAGTRNHLFRSKLVPVNAENVKAAVEFLEGRHLIGALDLAKAFDDAQPFLKGGHNPHLVHLGSGVAAMGERRIADLSARIPDGAKYVGVGVGKRWNRDFMKAASERTGGFYTQINPDEPIAWRAFELAATLNTPRLMNVKVSADKSAKPFLTFSTAIAQGEEVCAVARFGPNEPLPAQVNVSGSLDGQGFGSFLVVPPAQTLTQAGHLPRTWAKLEIERRLAEPQTQDERKQIVDLSKATYVMTPYTSLLVLENEDMYKRFKVDRGRKDHWAPYPAPAKIEVVYEPQDGQFVDARFAPKAEKPHANQVLDTILVRMPPTMLVWPNRNQAFRGTMVVTALNVYRGAFALPGTIPPPPGFGGGQGAGLDSPAPVAEDLGGEWGVPGPVNTNDGVGMTNFSIDRLGSVIMAGDRWKEDQSNGMLTLAAAPHSPVAGKQAAMRMRGRSGATREKMLREGGGHVRDEGRRMQIERLSVDRDAAANLADDAIFAFVADDLSKNGESLKMLKNTRGDWGKGKAEGEKGSLSWAEANLDGLVRGHRQAPPFYGRPSFSLEERVFFDLLSYAPGLNTSSADIEAVKEAEAMPGLDNLPGQIDPAARKLVEAARTGGWRTLHVGKGDGAYTITFDGQGRYAYERTLPLGLHERVVCDGKTLLHLYPELGLGARRPFSRFHRAQLTERVPWLLPSAEDLAHGGDLRLIKDRTVAVVPRGAEEARDDNNKPVPYVQVQFVFGSEGKLTERRIVEMPADKVLYRESYDTDAGSIRLTNAEGKELSKRELRLGAGAEPNFRPNTDKLVVLPLPYRSRDQVYRQYGVHRHMLYDPRTSWTFELLDPDAALALFTAEFAAGDYQTAQRIHKLCFAFNGIHKLGFYTMLAAGNVPVCRDADFINLWEADPKDPLASYLSLHLNPRYGTWQQDWGLHLGELAGAPDSFLGRLSRFHDLYLRWRSGNANLGTDRPRQAEQQRAFAFVQQNRKNVLGWAMLSLLADHADDPAFHRTVAATWKELDAGTELSYIARYEHARSLLRAGDTKAAAEHFRTLYQKVLKEGYLPPLDGDFRYALQQDGSDLAWTELVRQTADQLLKDKHRTAVVTLAWQCWQLGDAGLSQNLVEEALRSPSNDAERLEVTVAVLEYLTDTNQYVEADARVTALLKNPEFAKQSNLWRLAAQIADQRGLTAQAITCLETALDLEYQSKPAVINLQEVRQDYGRLLSHYQWLAGAVEVMKVDPPADLLPRTIRAADRWRALDRDSSQSCDQAARVLKVLRARDLAWDYLTTPVGQHPNEAAPWRNLAVSLSYQGDLDLADRAFKAAFEAEPTDAQILWDRAENLKRAGKQAEAQELLKQIARGKDWQPRFNWLKRKPNGS